MAEVNLLELKPERIYEWVYNPTGDEETSAKPPTATILVPKVKTKWLARLLQPRLQSQHYRIRLDSYGTAVWQCCDGNTTVRSIGNEMERRFGSAIAPVYDRLALFLRQLERNRLIRYNNLAAAKSRPPRVMTTPKAVETTHPGQV